MFTTRRSSLYSNVTKKVTQARKGLGTNSVDLATELSLVSKLLQKVIPKKISAYGLQNQICGVIVISYNLIRGSSFQCCHMIVNEPIETIYQTESDERMRKSTWKTTDTNVWRGVSPVYFYISNSFSSYFFFFFFFFFWIFIKS